MLFDLDGVPVDSTPAVERVWGAWAVEHGFDPHEIVRRAHGRPSLATLRELLPNGNPEKENLEVERREIADLEGVVPLPGVLDLLRQLPADHWTIVTSCTRPLALVRIQAAAPAAPQSADDFPGCHAYGAVTWNHVLKGASITGPRGRGLPGSGRRPSRNPGWPIRRRARPSPSHHRKGSGAARSRCQLDRRRSNT